MTNSSERRAPASPPERGAGSASVHSRFIPREELDGFAAWRPHAFCDDSAAPGTPHMRGAPTDAQRHASHDAALAAARQEGYQAGYRDGLVALESFKQSFGQQLAAQIGSLVAAFGDQFDALEAQIADAVARTATALARQVVRNEIDTRPALVASVAAEAVNAVLLSARHIRVFVHPDDQPLVAAGAADALAARQARLVPDATLARGGCRIESDLGSIDASLDTRWTQAAAALGQDMRLQGPHDPGVAGA